MSVLPQESQPIVALRRANDVRLAVAEFKREIAALPRPEAISAVIDAIENRHHDTLLGAARARHLLLGVPGIGDGKSRKLLTVAQIHNFDKRLRDLTARQRDLLVILLEQQGWRRS